MVSADHEAARPTTLIMFQYICVKPISYKRYFSFVSNCGSFVFDSVSTVTENEIMNVNSILYEDCETESVESSRTIYNKIRCVGVFYIITFVSR